MDVSVTNLQTTSVTNDTADIAITYGTTRVETYRKVVIGTLAGHNLRSRHSPLLSSSAPIQPADGIHLSVAEDPVHLRNCPEPRPAPIDRPAGDGQVFTDNFPLDKIDFNLLVIPGITDPAVLAEGVAYAERKRLFYIMDSPEDWEVDAPDAAQSPPRP